MRLSDPIISSLLKFYLIFTWHKNDSNYFDFTVNIYFSNKLKKILYKESAKYKS